MMFWTRLRAWVAGMMVGLYPPDLKTRCPRCNHEMRRRVIYRRVGNDNPIRFKSCDVYVCEFCWMEVPN